MDLFGIEPTADPTDAIPMVPHGRTCGNRTRPIVGEIRAEKIGAFRGKKKRGLSWLVL